MFAQGKKGQANAEMTTLRTGGGGVNLARFAFFIGLKWVLQHDSQSSLMSTKRMFKPLVLEGRR